ncbi:hypothetical protein NDU88_001000 [Pleurodeles waltl]|uniref:Uncharacterized protein n=1 Tax=Pleurodeles waltl TaxID=8319 RepID=A0AAV7SYB1_PLEWA|nr:hypothetical protein NDU88_001000 [Pleurodeles waltl]
MERRSRNNDYASRKRRTQNNTIRVGNTLLVKDRHLGGKFRLPFKAELWTVTAVKGTMIAGRAGDGVTRNVSQLKRFSSSSSSGNGRDSSLSDGSHSDPESAVFSPESSIRGRPTLEDSVTTRRPTPLEHSPSAVAGVPLPAGDVLSAGGTQKMPSGLWPVWYPAHVLFPFS